MSVFNLSDHLKEATSFFIFKFAQRHGWRHQKNREQYQWWDYEDLASGHASNINEWHTSVAGEPSLNGIVNEAISFREKGLSGCSLIYGIPHNIAEKMVKTYIGYSPAYGGYLCQIGPYLPPLDKEGKAKSNAIPEAMQRFSFYVLRKRKSSPESVGESVANKIKHFSKNFAQMTQLVNFEPSDFSYNVKVKTEQEVQEEIQKRRQRSKGEKEIKKKRVPPFKRLETLDPNDPSVQEFFKDPPIEGTGTGVDLNSRGYIKILRQYLGPWSSKVIAEQMAETHKTEDEIISKMLTDEKMLRIVYARSVLLYNQAKEAGDPVALAVGQPPDYKDKRLQGKSGQQYGSSPGQAKRESIVDDQGNVIGEKVIEPAARTKLLIRSLSQRKEAMQILADIRAEMPSVAGPVAPVIDEAQAVADRLNKNPKRIKDNKLKDSKKKRCMKKLESLSQKQAAGDITEEEAKYMLFLSDEIKKNNPVIWTKEDVNILFSEMKQESLNNPSNAVQEIGERMTLIDDSSGYDDLLTAFNMAKIFFSARSVDGVSGAKIGGANSIIFNPPENFNNYTSEDIKKFVEAKERGDVVPEEATPEELQKEIGDIGPEKVTPGDLFEDDEDYEEEEGEVGDVPVTQIPPADVVTPHGEVDVPANAPVPGVPPPVEQGVLEKEKKKEKKLKRLDELLGTTLINLVRVAEDLDMSGKHEAAEEVHKIIRKYEEKI